MHDNITKTNYNQGVCHIQKHISLSIGKKIHKHIDTNSNVTKIQWKNNSYIGERYEKIPKME